MQTNQRVKESDVMPLIRMEKGWSLHAPFNLADPVVVETKALQGLVLELQVYLVISPFYIKLIAMRNLQSGDL